MASNALQGWRTESLARLLELEKVHEDLTGNGPGRRWGTTQLNRSLHTALTAQFQQFCRGLHDEAVDVHVSVASPGQGPILQALLTQGRKLDVGNPRKSALGSDFVRVGIDLVSSLKARGALTTARLDTLEDLIDFRNAIGHGDEAKIAALVNDPTRWLASTKTSYQRCRRALNGLAGTMDGLVADQLVVTLGVAKPW